MRYLFILLLIPALSYSQDSTKTLSKYERFSAVTGTLFKTETKEIKKVKELTVSLVKTTHLGSGQSVSAVQIFQKTTSVFAAGNLGTVYIDTDELEGVINALKYCLGQIKKGKPQNQLAFSYATANNVQISCAYSEGGSVEGWFIGLSQRYAKGGGMLTLRNKDIDDFAEAIINAKTTAL